jgi:hypothetical protein
MAKYAIKVAEMKEIAEKLSQQLYGIHQQAEQAIAMHRESLAPAVYAEAYERLDVGDILREIVELDQRIKTKATRVNEMLSDEKMLKFNHPYHQALHHDARTGERAKSYLNGAMVDSAEVRAEADVICRERGFPPLWYKPLPWPNPKQLIDQMKGCKNVNEIHALVKKHQNDALNHARPVIEAAHKYHNRTTNQAKKA